MSQGPPVCASCNATVEQADRFCPRCGHDQEVATIDLASTGATSGTSSVSNIESRRVRKAPILLGLILAIAIAIPWFLNRNGDSPAPGSADTGEVSDESADNGTEVEDPDEPSARAVLNDADVETVAATQAQFPLFPDSERHLIIGRRGAEIALIDSESGAIQKLQLRSDTSFELPHDGYSVGAVLERLIAIDTGNARSFSLTGGADFDLSGNVTAMDVRQGPRLVVASELSGVSAQTYYEVQAFGSYEIFPSESGIVPLNAQVVAIGERVFFEAGGQVFEHRVELVESGGFTALGIGKLIGAGRNHIILDECTETLDCTPMLVAGDTAVMPLELPQSIPTPIRVSPDGGWVVSKRGSGLQAQALGSDVSLNLPTTPFLGVSWTADSRYLVASGSGSMLIADTITGETTNIDIDGTGEVFDEILVVAAPPGWSPSE